ncbi:Retrovirus-related Pol polyprotein like [Argiope bruennichi]|uniref:Retrovirus-related Pol polyprotein like n=1 Tax=Argiope bruennichi TaxID=94029 RepID=A0A8T0FHL1_ARGBR|nr:Retrovirus-related Pol polyprotein like [Argiope bruennichi]
MVIDYRHLNSQTIKDKFPLPCIDDLLERLSGFSLSCILDACQGFNRILMDEESSRKAAFTTPDEHYEPIRLFFGLSNAPPVFQRAVSLALGDLLWSGVSCFMDDIFFGSSDFDDMIAKLRQVLEKLLNAGVTLKLSKCEFGISEIEYLGFVIDKVGIRNRTRPKKKCCNCRINEKVPCGSPPRLRWSFWNGKNNVLYVHNSKVPGGKSQGISNSISPGSQPFEVIHMDFLGPFETSTTRNKKLLVFVDNMTKFVRLRPCSSSSTKSVLKYLDEFTNDFGCPRRFVTDRGSCFSSSLFEDYCKHFAIKHTLNSNQRPQANGQVERINRIHIPMISSSFQTESHKDWDKILP